MIEAPTYPKPVHSRPRSGLARALKIVLALVVLALVAGVIYEGIRLRIRTATAVKQETLYLSVPSVSVVHPKLGSATNEVVLPGSIQAFIDSPIYARASGYVKQWYTDIGTRVKAGQALAEIDAPELDQQVTQAKGAVAHSQAAVEQAAANLQQGR
ncbi:MAG TPA: biotin/lipoyl-binding protein, partial [Candidatus Sulfopaludibacter sp.]|nr:biotin/lipoyl-binding protein [Candidatus Sulfopaludibacter sp.]